MIEKFPGCANVKILNRKKLIENGETSVIRRGRELSLECLEQAVNAVEPKRLIKEKMRIMNDQLLVEGCTFDLAKFKHVYVLGGGKAGAKWHKLLKRYWENM